MSVLSQEVWQADSETAARGSRVRGQFRQLQGSKKGVLIRTQTAEKAMPM
jgi:hypothetical protein